MNLQENNQPCCQICFVQSVEDIMKRKDNAKLNTVHAYRIIGRLLSHDVQTCQAFLQDPFKSSKQLTIDTTLIEPFLAHSGSLFQILGELEMLDDEIVLKAQIANSIDGMDINLLKESLDLQRQYFDSR